MAVFNLLNVFLSFVIVFIVETQCSPHYGVQGGEIILTPTISEKPEEILWKHNRNKVVEFDGTHNTEYGRYKGRTDLNLINGQLIIRGLTDADSGFYQLEAIVNQMLQHSDHEVQVIDAVPQPSVYCKSCNSGTTLLCSADLHPLTQFLWRIPGGSETPGSELFIPVDENQESVYKCVVKNPVGNKTAEFTLKECHTEEGSSVLAVVLPIFCTVLFILCVLLAIWWWCWKTKKAGRSQTDQNLKAKYTPAVSKDEESLLLQSSSSTNPLDSRVPLDENGMELNSPEIQRIQENLQPPVHINQPNNKKVELDMQTSSTQGQAEIPTPLQDPVQPDPKSEDTKGDTQSNIQTKEPNQETETSHQTKEPNQETQPINLIKIDHQTPEPDQENKTDHQTLEPDHENTIDHQTLEPDHETKTDAEQTEESESNDEKLSTPKLI